MRGERGRESKGWNGKGEGRVDTERDGRKRGREGGERRRDKGKGRKRGGKGL